MKHLLNVRNLQTYFFTYSGVIRAVDGVTFTLSQGETLGIVGETGCGKSVTALSILRLVPHPGKIVDGTIMFDGNDLLKQNEKDMNHSGISQWLTLTIYQNM